MNGDNDKPDYLDIILNNEDVVFTTNFMSVNDSMRIYLSEENTVYYSYLKRSEQSGVKLDVLNQLPQFFPKTDDFYPAIKKQYERELKKYQEYVKKLLKENANTYAARYIKSDMLPILQFDLITVEKNEFLKRHFFDQVNFSDTLLLNSDIFANKAIKYIKLFQNPYYMKPIQDKEYQKAVDSIMIKASVNDKVYDYLLGYIINGFERIENEEVLTYISDHYSGDNRCKDNDHLSRLNKRVEGFKKIAIGTIAPDISIKDINGRGYSFADINTPYTLLVFWATWCPHCVETLPDIKKIYDKQAVKNIEVVAISLDSNMVSWTDFIRKGQYSWINSADLAGWEGKAAQDYYIYATPTMLLLNKDKKILGKPKTIKELSKLLKEQGI
jgi:thiol-disulfide isomerase/thioredoxin